MSTIAALLPITALANAAIPSSTIAGTLTTNSDGTETLTINGTWTWPGLSGDCNLRHRAVGFAIDWNDTTQPGNPVATVGGVQVAVGAAAANARNAQDNAVHPTPLTEFPNAWGGCGRPNSQGVSAGAWGPISHVYPAGSGPSFTVCAVMYDVMLNANGGQPTSARETRAGGSNHNGDNSAQQNGAVSGCQTITPPTPPVPGTGAASGTSSQGLFQPWPLALVGAGSCLLVLARRRANHASARLDG
jgi:hypothetical protein